jgi:hypothetical protein
MLVDVKNPVVALFWNRDKRTKPGAEADRQLGILGWIEDPSIAMDVMAGAIWANCNVMNGKGFPVRRWP